MTPRYPNIYVKLVGEDGNAFSILGRVSKALKQGGVPPAEVEEFMDEATAGDYNHLLATCMNWVSEDSMDGEDEDEDYDRECRNCGYTSQDCDCDEFDYEDEDDEDYCDGCGMNTDECVCDDDETEDE